MIATYYSFFSSRAARNFRKVAIADLSVMLGRKVLSRSRWFVIGEVSCVCSHASARGGGTGWGRAAAGGGAAEAITVLACDRGAHPMLPVALRSVPLLDDREERAVLCVDVHDSLPRQVTRSATPPLHPKF